MKRSITILIACVAFVFSSLTGWAQSIEISKVWEGTGFATTATTYLGGQTFAAGYLDSLVVVTENYDSLTAVVKLVSYSPNGLPIDTITALASYTTTTATAKYSAAIAPLVRRQFLRPLVTASRTNGQTSNHTMIKIYIYKYGIKP